MSSNPELSTTLLFERGDMGYETFRIPAISTTKAGTVVAMCAARKELSDWADIDIAMRRSTDGGLSWTEAQIIAGLDSTGVTDNPTMIPDTQTGALHLLFQTDYQQVWYARSDDEGQTFSAPRDITQTCARFRDDYPWVVIAPGPGHGVHMSSGRLVFPVWLSDGTGPSGDKRGRAAHRPSIVGTVYSDDGGETWERGEVIAWTDDDYKFPSETSMVELTDGSLLVNMRSESREYLRLQSVSRDGATGWSKPRFVPELFEPVCFGAMCPVPGRPGALAFVNPDSRDNKAIGWSLHKARIRENLTVYLSTDDGTTWPVKKVIDPGVAGYSDVFPGPDGSLLCLYEHGGKMADNTRMSVVRLEQSWLFS